MRSNEGKWQDSLDLETVFHEGSSLGEPEPWAPDLFGQPTRLDLYDLVPDGKLNQIAVRTKVEFPHNIGPVGVHGLHAEV